MVRAISSMIALLGGIVLADPAVAEVCLAGLDRHGRLLHTGRHIRAVTAGPGALLPGVGQRTHAARDLLHR